MNSNNYQVTVVGAGHAGIEAALACSRLGVKTLLVTINADNIGYMSCNPAIGGLAKGQLVKELDALGAEIGKAADEACIQFRKLNKSRGVAVQSSRTQTDKKEYNLYMKNAVETQDNLHVKQAKVLSVLIKKNRVFGIKTKEQGIFYSDIVIITPGTFLDGMIHIGLNNFPAGRMGEEASPELSKWLKDAGFECGKFKTGTCPRLDARTINFDILEKQTADKNPEGFSLFTDKIKSRQMPCYITYTNEKTKNIIKQNLDKSPLYTGKISAKGVRYCPSIEDKIVKFPDRERHTVFLEPEGRKTVEIYPNGISTSLPIDVQKQIVASIKGLEKAEIIRPGYGIEHDYVHPTQLKHTLETKKIENLFFAGQINGTTGYEEAAAQGFVAGVNAANKILGRPAFITDRTLSYIGVLIDDLVTMGVDEPYRMFTSRAEYRLLLREDNVDLRLLETGYNIGLISEDKLKEIKKKEKEIKKAKAFLRDTLIMPQDTVNKQLKKVKSTPLTKPEKAVQLLKRPFVDRNCLVKIMGKNIKFSDEILKQVEIDIKYEGYIKRQKKQIDKFLNLEKIKIPSDFKFTGMSGLSKEITEKLNRVRPLTLGQAARIPGITPGALAVLMAFLGKKSKLK